MVWRRLIRPGFPIAVCAGAALLCAAPGRAAPRQAKDPRACASAYKVAQEKEQGGQLRGARELYVTCATSKCGATLLHACTDRFVELDLVDMPTILPRVTDETGAARADVKVRLDGELLTSHLDGQPLPVDPGVHELSFNTDNGLVAIQKIMLAQGQRNRLITVSLHPGEAPVEKEAQREDEATAAAGAPPASGQRGEAKPEKPGPERPAASPTPEAPLPKSPQACMAAYRGALDKEQAGQLREARQLLVTCARAACGRSVLQACAARFTQIDSVDIPSILPVVTDETGAQRVDVQVRMDGELLAARLTGQALSVDPGLHEFAFTAEGGLSATEKILIVQGQLGRPISVSLRASEKPIASEKGPATGTDASQGGAPPPQAAPPEDRPVVAGRSPVPYIIGGAVLAAVETGALAVYLGKGDTTHLAADVSIGVSLGVGAAALGVASWLFLAPHASSEKPAAPQTGCVFDVQPTPSGAYASVSGAF